MIFRFILLLLFFLTTQLKAAELSNSQRLRRLSIHLTGTAPLAEEFEELDTSSDKEVFFQKITEKYMQKSNFVNLMVDNLDALFKLKINYHNNYPNETSSGDLSKDNSMRSLFSQIIKNNESWDNLLVKKSFDIGVNTKGSRFIKQAITDLGFYGFVFEDQLGKFTDASNNNSYMYLYKGKSKTPDIVTVESKTTLQRQSVAGALTTARFFNRFPTTKINKNRKRAAAIFNIFLCDEMKPVILPSSSANSQLLMLSLGRRNGKNIDPTDINELEKKHGEDPGCASCHNKLDPMGKTFSGSSRILNKPAQGALVYRDANNQPVNIPVSGLGELGEAIVEQPAYASCQVNHFWNWFIGKDIPLSSKKRAELVVVFNEVGRKPKAFISYLVNSSDFYSPQTLDLISVNFDHVKPIFKRCNSCHDEDNSWTPDLLYYLKEEPKYKKEYIKDLIKALDLNGKHGGADMPPKKAGWELTSKQEDLIRAWIIGGAKDPRGEMTVPADFITEISDIKIENENTELLPSFDYSYNRYLSGNRLLISLSDFFDLKNSTECFGALSRNHLAHDNLGFSNPILGEVNQKTPGSDYLRQIESCFNFDTGYGEPKLKIELDTELEQKYEWDETDLKTIAHKVYNLVYPHNNNSAVAKGRIIESAFKKAKSLQKSSEGNNDNNSLILRMTVDMIFQPEFLVY